MRRSAAYFTLLLTLFFLASGLEPSPTRAYINQADGTVVPVSDRLQQCLDLSEATPMAVDSIADAAVLPEAYRPVFDAPSGHYRVTFTDIGEGAGFRNSFGWFWIGTDVTNPANLYTVFGCRTYGQCDCPCTTTRTRQIDFDTQPGFSPGRQIGFWLRTPERLDGSRESGTFPSGCSNPIGCDPTGTNVDDSCGGRRDTNNRIYYTSSALNDDGDYVHFLVYRSVARVDTFYFGFEDLWRGGDNDYEDMLVRGSGLVPNCDPRPETCNNVDDDCDGVIDEGLTQACSTACGAGVRTCAAGTWGTCSARTPSTEVCNGVDDNCNGSIDEGLTRSCSNDCGSGTEICIAGSWGGCSARTPTIETCNGVDDDCDGSVDEGLTRSCSNACGSGVQTCSAGSWGTCSARTPSAEVCNGIDDNCNGIIDEGLSRSCSNACGTGTEVCREGAWGGCTAPAPGIEVCNNLDDDCNGLVDDGITRACSTACGVGTERCVAGAFVGCDAPLPGVEVCNNVDDDCNGIIDDGNPGGGAACIPREGGGYDVVGEDFDDDMICRPGTVRCVMGELICSGAASGAREVCNCLDDDCDGLVDEDTAGAPLCPGGACIDCNCASPCDPGEFPCPPGRICDESLGDGTVIGYCVPGRCAGVTCDSESTCNPETGECENLCESVSCREGYACVRGGCIEDNCYGRGCPTGETCRMQDAGVPTCVEDGCRTVTCGEGTFCRDGACVPTCDVVCDVGSRCVDGACVADACGGACGAGQTCADGRCVDDVCAAGCGRGRVCRAGACVDDPCRNVSCPGALECDDGQCVDPSIVPHRPSTHGLATGGGGCLCSAVGATETSGGGRGLAGLVALALFGLLGARRRRRATPCAGPRHVRPTRTGAARLSGALLGLVLASGGLAQGCAVEPFCITNCEEDQRVDAARPDASRPDSGVVSTDGCIPSGVEICDGIDNDCDGLVDEDFDLDEDPRNCGRCDHACALEHAFPACGEGECLVDRCEIGWVDLDGIPGNGCEYSCPPDGVELCDGRDNDCDGRVDEDFDLSSDLANCGACGNACRFANGTASCVAGVCELVSCNTGFVDSDGDAATGCEYACTPRGAEVCNGVDDNCNGSIDEGFDLSSDPNNCGACGRVCSFPNATGRCVAGACTFAASDCRPGFHDVDGDPRTGCEYACTATGRADTCDGVDDDCDGIFDEDDPMVGTSCGSNVGACTRGTTACVRGALTCIGGVGPIAELCDGVDNDCDGTVDESTAASPIRGVGERCGATNVGICTYGTTVCSGGAITCSGGVTARAETCNGLDDNCNGVVDDGLTPPAASTVTSCAESRGVCAGRVPSCRGTSGWGCDLPALYQAVETRCDGLDNDCDGTTDEGCLRVTGSDVRIDNQTSQSATNSMLPDIAASGANVQVTWIETIANGGELDARIYSNYSTNSGGAFSTARRLNGTNGDTFRPTVVFTSSNVLWAWADFRGGTSFREIWTRRSTDVNGATLAGSEVRANAVGATNVMDAYNVRVARSGTNVVAVFEAVPVNARSRHIYLTRSTDQGATWSTPLQVSSGTGTNFIAAQARVAASSTRAYVVWRDNRAGSLDVYLRAYTISTNTFVAAEQRMDVGTTAGSSSSFSPDVAAEGNNVYVTWVDDRDRGSFDIWLNRSTNSGTSWLTNAVKLDGDPLDHDSITPYVIAPSAGRVVVSWIDYRSGFPDPYVIQSSTAGASFTTPTRVDTGTAAGTSGSYDLALAGDGSLIAVAWADDRAGLLDVYANFSLDDGVTWQPQDYRLDSSAAGSSDSELPALAVSGSRIHAAWVDHRRGSSCPVASGASCPNGDIYYRRIE